MIAKIKIITGFRKDQEFSIDAAEAHKAYYLFLHPEARSVFSGGLALKGSDIQRIEPDYGGTMGWNEAHTLDADDWNEIRKIGLDKKLRDVMSLAKDVAKVVRPEELLLRLSDAAKRHPELTSPIIEKLALPSNANS